MTILNFTFAFICIAFLFIFIFICWVLGSLFVNFWQEISSLWDNKDE